MHEYKLNSLSPAYHIKTGELIDPTEAILLMTAGGNFFSFSVMNHLSKKIFEFGYFNLPQIEEDGWSDFFDRNQVFNGNYRQSAIAYNLSASVSVPAEYYKADEMQTHLDAIFGQDFHSVLITEHLPEWNIYNIARLPESLQSSVNRRFRSVKSWSSNSVLLKNSREDKQNSILIDFRTDEFSVLAFKNGKLQLLKSYSYSSPEDVLYLLLKICEQTGLSQNDVKIVLSGLIEKDSAIYRELYKYFIFPEFDDLPEDINIADELTECPRHFFSSVCKLATCVL